MSETELTRVHVIRQALGKALRSRDAGEALELMADKVRPLIQRVWTEHASGLMHRFRGKPADLEQGANAE